MKPAAAFAAGLWVGAVAAAAIGMFYLRVWELGRREGSPQGREMLESRIQGLQQEQSRAQAEAARLRQTIVELQHRLDVMAAVDERRQWRAARQEAAATRETNAPSWIAQAVERGDAGALPRLEQAAVRNDVSALEAIALLSDKDNGETLTSVWNSNALQPATRQRAARLLAA